MTTLYDAHEQVWDAMVQAAAKHGAEVRDFSFTLARDGLLLTVSQQHDEDDAGRTEMTRIAQTRDERGVRSPWAEEVTDDH